MYNAEFSELSGLDYTKFEEYIGQLSLLPMTTHEAAWYIISVAYICLYVCNKHNF